MELGETWNKGITQKALENIKARVRGFCWEAVGIHRRSSGKWWSGVKMGKMVLYVVAEKTVEWVNSRSFKTWGR
nr:hypothetical protein [Tanacetum cinerariifolium]